MEGPSSGEFRVHEIQIGPCIRHGTANVSIETTDEILLGFPDTVHSESLHDRDWLFDQTISVPGQRLRPLEEVKPHDNRYCQGVEDVEDAIEKRVVYGRPDGKGALRINSADGFHNLAASDGKAPWFMVRFLDLQSNAVGELQ